MSQALKRRVLWLAVVLAMLSAGYTAGYLIAPPKPAAITLTLPQAPVDAPQPLPPAEVAEEDA
jgi:hypothetical protein